MDCAQTGGWGPHVHELQADAAVAALMKLCITGQEKPCAVEEKDCSKGSVLLLLIQAQLCIAGLGSHP